MSSVSPPRSTSSFSKCGSGSAPAGSGFSGSEMSKTVRPSGPVTYMWLPRMRAPIGCTPGTVKTGVMLSEISGRDEVVMRGAAEADEASASAATRAAIHGSARGVSTELLFPVFGLSMRIRESLALELDGRLHLAQRRCLSPAVTRVRAVEGLQPLRQLAQRLGSEVRVVAVGALAVRVSDQPLLRERRDHAQVMDGGAAALGGHRRLRRRRQVGERGDQVLLEQPQVLDD